jgi:hypothetical protein
VLPRLRIALDVKFNAAFGFIPGPPNPEEFKKLRKF